MGTLTLELGAYGAKFYPDGSFALYHADYAMGEGVTLSAAQFNELMEHASSIWGRRLNRYVGVAAGDSSQAPAPKKRGRKPKVVGLPKRKPVRPRKAAAK